LAFPQFAPKANGEEVDVEEVSSDDSFVVSDTSGEGEEVEDFTFYRSVDHKMDKYGKMNTRKSLGILIFLI
jgi:hypothetical protein